MLRFCRLVVFRVMDCFFFLGFRWLVFFVCEFDIMVKLEMYVKDFIFMVDVDIWIVLLGIVRDCMDFWKYFICSGFIVLIRDFVVFFLICRV